MAACVGTNLNNDGITLYEAMAALFLGRWPGGRGPTWASGEPEPWPSQMEMARRREEQAQQTRVEPEEPAAPKPRRKKRRYRRQ